MVSVMWEFKEDELWGVAREGNCNYCNAVSEILVVRDI